jgi:hypothetical protein
LQKIRLDIVIDVSIAVVAACGVCVDGVAAAEGAAVEEAVGKVAAETKIGSVDDPAGRAVAAGVSLGRPRTTLEVCHGNHTKFNKLSLCHCSPASRRRMERLRTIPYVVATMFSSVLFTRPNHTPVAHWLSSLFSCFPGRLQWTLSPNATSGET